MQEKKQISLNQLSEDPVDGRGRVRVPLFRLAVLAMILVLAFPGVGLRAASAETEAVSQEEPAEESETGTEESSSEEETTAEPETTAAPKKKKKKKKGKWVKKKGYYCYKNAKGKKVTGLQKIGKKIYYFDKKGIQRTGWRKVGSNYYFFLQKSGKKGYMKKSCKVNGIKLKKNGKAVLNSRSRKKLKLMAACAKIVDAQTKPSQTQKKKLKILFEYTKKEFSAWNMGDFRKKDDWDVWYAQYMLDHKRGDCYAYGAIFAYLANAAGCKNVCAESSGGHGWAEINGKFYDPNWAYVMGTEKCFAVPKSLSGSGGRPAWAKNRTYVKKI